MSRLPGPVLATGGDTFDIAQDGVAYRVHRFESSDDFVVLADQLEVEYLVVAGGGGGGGTGPGGGGGGGGAGGLLTGTTAVLSQSYSVVVGAPGDGGAGATNKGSNGNPSSVFSFSALGGGGGGSISGTSTAVGTGNNGGSGGGGGSATNNQTLPGGTGTAGQGNNGGTGFGSTDGDSARSGGGGGGAGAVGGNAGFAVAGAGGGGVTSSISGTAVGYAGGGGGGTRGTGGGGSSDGGGASGIQTNGGNGVNGTGGGGGGGGGDGSVSASGGNGGSGVVIIRYVIDVPAIGGTDVFDIVVDGEYARVHVFEGSDDFTVLADALDVEALVVAGGGSGGSAGGAGGGAGGLLTGSLALVDGSFTVVVGAGGAPATSAPGNAGTASSFVSLSAVGGGRGGNQGVVSRNGGPGGSGGGGGGAETALGIGGAGTLGQGNAGGDGSTNFNAGGGGGAGTAGGNAAVGVGGNGGDGLFSSITGTATFYAGGGGGMSNTTGQVGGDGGVGGGGAGNEGAAPGNGVDGLGGGGGGTRGIRASGAGGSGVVVVRYLIPLPPLPPQQGTIRIEIAFTSTVGSDDPAWEDVSDFFIDGLEISRGRNRAVDLFTAGRASFRLDNRNRTFDPTNTSSPFSGNIIPMRPVRIFADNGFEEELLFRGFVTDWTFRYGRPNDAWVDVDCVDAFVVFASDDLAPVAPVGDEDTSDERVDRVLDAIGFGSDRNLTPGQFELAETEFGSNALAEMELAATSDQSLLFMSRDGLVTLLNPLTVFASPPVLSFQQANVVGNGEVRYHGVEVQTASELLYNRVSVVWDGGTVVREDAASVAEFLPRTLTVRTTLKNEGDAEQVGDFILARLATPELRLKSATVKMHDRRIAPGYRADVCRLDVGKTVTVVRRAPGSGVPSQVAFRQVVEGLVWRYARDSWTVSLSLGDIVGAPFTLDDAVLGALDTGGILKF